MRFVARVAKRSGMLEPMPVYAMFEITLLPDPSPEDQAAYEHYRSVVPGMIAEHGGVYLARAWNGEALEGAPAGDRFHLLEFPDAEAARGFWESPEYRALKHGRDGAVSVRAVLLHPA